MLLTVDTLNCPSRHRRAPALGAPAAVPEPPAQRQEAAGRRQLRVGRRRDPQRHRHPVREHPEDEQAAGLLRGVPAQALGAGRAFTRASDGAPLAGAHHPGRQRLREQLLPRPLLPALPPVRAARLRPLPRVRVQEDPHRTLRCPSVHSFSLPSLYMERYFAMICLQQEI
jgi:hypothetical protein